MTPPDHSGVRRGKVLEKRRSGGWPSIVVQWDDGTKEKIVVSAQEFKHSAVGTEVESGPNDAKVDP